MRGALVALLLACAPAAAETVFELPPGAAETARIEETGRHLLPTARFTPAHAPGLTLEGRILIRAWRVPLDRADTPAVMRALRLQVEEKGFRVLHDCAARDCGGFDFRFRARVLDPPAMRVDLADFRYLSARRPEGGHHLGILVSTERDGGYVQITEVLQEEVVPAEVVPPEPAPGPAEAPPPTDVARLLDTGRVVLAQVDFAPGGTRVAASAEPELAALAAVLYAHPELAVVIVGHTDNTGSLDINRRISRARAEAVRRALIGAHGVAPGRITAEGAGYLAPIAPNATEEGRAANRRVEVILR